MIEIQNVNKSFYNKKIETQVLKDINLEIKKGQVYGIIGRSGAGKSTLLRCLNLLEKPDSGSIKLDGIDLTTISKSQLRQKRREIGVIFQHFNLLNSKTVFENIALPLKLWGNNSKLKIKEEVDNMLKLVGLEAYANSYPQNLSGGQKQRVGIARALINKPKVLLSDEATSALDPQTTNSILELLLDINQKLGLTIVLITHEIEVIRKICDKVAVMDEGRIIEQGDAFSVILHPGQELTRKLIIEEETSKYLDQIQEFYTFNKQNNHLVLISFIGEKTYQPILNTISRKTNINFSILRGELGRIKKMPFGQLLVEISASSEKDLKAALRLLDEHGVHFEVLY